MVTWPPAPVMELARLAVDSGGDPGAIQRLLDPTMLPVSARCCSIMSEGYGISHSLGRSSFAGECNLRSGGTQQHALIDGWGMEQSSVQNSFWFCMIGM
jgi:hypothetical protein